MAHDAQQTAQICYGMAYFLLPKYIFERTAETVQRLSKEDGPQALYYYVMACKVQNVEPQQDLKSAFPVHIGDFDEQHRCVIIQYPTPPPVDMRTLLHKSGGLRDNATLAPYFSAIIQNKLTEDVQYYIIGQSPSGGTTLRRVSKEGMNANMGPGCEPEINAFIDLLKTRAVDSVS